MLRYPELVGSLKKLILLKLCGPMTHKLLLISREQNILNRKDFSYEAHES